MSDSPEKKTNAEGYGTTGHSWDGIEEWNNPLPRWWVWTFYATIAWGVVYTIAYPAWPLINSATAGFLGYSSRAEVAAQIDEVAARNAAITERLANVELAALPADTELHTYAVNAGGAVYRNNCSQCHGTGAAGVAASGYPNLLDNAWLWGGSIEEIAYTVEHGIRNEQSLDARWSEMTAFDELLSDEEISQVVNYVLAISGQEHDAALAALGETVYLDNCAACHGDAGEGIRDLGAPTLNDAIWLYGGDAETIEETVRYARFGVMPAWSEEFRGAAGLSRAEINAVAAYVHQLGGGE